MALEKLAKTLVRKAGQAASKAQPFYSPIDEAIANITQGKGTGAQMLAELMKTKGVAKELKDRPAIKKALEASKDTKVTKADVERVAAENPAPQIEQNNPRVAFDEYNPALPSDNSMVIKKNPNYPNNSHFPIGVYDRFTGKLIGGGDNDIDAIYDAFSGYPERWGEGAVATSAFSKFTIPGGENYREVLIKLPSNSPQNYRSSHFEEPNILAHARVTDRVGPNGERILHVEEVQSDWHQAGRKKGYGPKIEKTVEAYYETKDGQRIPVGFGKTREEADASIDIGWKNLVDIKYETFEKKIGEGVPDAPFKQNWHELVMKRLLDDAARNGYDKVVITPGAEQAKRYDLSRHVNEIAVPMVNENGVRSVRIDSVDGTSIKLMVDQNGVVTGYGSGSNQFTGKSLDEVIGKDMADKVMNAAPDTKFSGGNLQVGGEGMKGFYDQILPSYLNDYGKKYGARVGTYNLPDPEVHHIPTIADIERGGMDMFGRADLTPEETLQVEEAFKAQRSAETAIPLHSFDITPQMREEITTKGQSLYQVAPPVAIGAGAAMQEEEPTEYAGGGIIKKAAKALMSRAEQEANFAKFIAESKAPMRLYHGTIATEGGKREEAIRQMKPSKEGAFGSGVYLTPNSEYASTYTGIPARSQLERDMQTGSDYAKEHAAKLFARINRGEVKPHEVGGNMLPVFAQLKNPLILGQDQKTFDKATDALIKLGVEQGKAEKMIERMWEDKGNIGKQIQSRAQAQGYDGLMVYQDGELSEIVSYNPSAIKSAIGNEGTYDITNPDMNKAGGGAVRKALKAVLPKGQQDILPAAESAANLERFLAESAVKNRAYHGTQADFNEFKSGPRNRLVKGMWFTSNPESANFWAGNTEGSNVMPVHLSLKNPAGREEYDSMLNSLPDDKKRTSSQRASQLKKLGHDGLIVNEGTDNETYIAFNPNQIKSAIGNRGTYDINEADINKAKGGQVTNDAMWIALQNKQLRKKHGN